MRAIVITRQSMFGRAVRSLVEATPSALRDLVRGPVARVTLGVRTTGLKPLRPIDVVIPAEQTLSKRITMPRSARGDLVHTIDLFIRHDTPFEPGEVVVHAQENPARPGDEQISYLVRIVPRLAIEQGLRVLGRSRRRVRGILASGGSPLADEIDLAPALAPFRRLRSLLATLPIAILCVSLTLIAERELSKRQQEIAALESTVETTRLAVQSASRELEQRNGATSGRDELTALINQSPPVLTRLERVRQVLSASTEISRIVVSGSDMRLFIRSSDVLADVQSLAAASPSWESTIDGALNSDAMSGAEIATVLLRDKGERK